MRCSFSGAEISGCFNCGTYGMCYGPIYEAEPEETRCIVCGSEKDADELTHGICNACKTALLESTQALAAYAAEYMDDYIEFCAARAKEGADLL